MTNFLMVLFQMRPLTSLDEGKLLAKMNEFHFASDAPKFHRSWTKPQPCRNFRSHLVPQILLDLDLTS